MQTTTITKYDEAYGEKLLHLFDTEEAAAEATPAELAGSLIAWEELISVGAPVFARWTAGGYHWGERATVVKVNAKSVRVRIDSDGREFALPRIIAFNWSQTNRILPLTHPEIVKHLDKRAQMDARDEERVVARIFA